MSDEQPTANLEPGEHRDVPWAVYAAQPYANSTILRIFEQQSPFHAKAELDSPTEATPAMQFGSALHKKILEPAGFFDEWAVFDGVENPKTGERDYTFRTKAAKEKRDAMLEGHRGLLRQSEYEDLVSIELALSRHAEIMRLLRDDVGHSELTLIWDDPGSGLRCKARLDRFVDWAGGPLVVDLKSCPDASEQAWRRKLGNESLHVQAGFYMAGVVAVYGRDERFVHVAVESSKPHGMAAYELEPAHVQHGEGLAKKHLETWAECVQSGVWPCYNGGRIVPVGLMPWALETPGDWSFA